MKDGDVLGGKNMESTSILKEHKGCCILGVDSATREEIVSGSQIAVCWPMQSNDLC